MQRSLKGATVDTVQNNASIDNIIKKFTIIYGSIKSFYLVMRDFQRVANRIKGLLSRIRKRFPEKIPF